MMIHKWNAMPFQTKTLGIQSSTDGFLPPWMLTIP